MSRFKNIHPNRTAPRPEEVAQFDELTIADLEKLLAAGRVALARKRAQKDAKRGKV